MWCSASHYLPFFLALQNDDLRNLSLSGHVGFDSLPDQLVNKSTSQGFCFNILCVGKSQCTRVPKLAPSPLARGETSAICDHSSLKVTVPMQSLSRVKSTLLSLSPSGPLT